MSKPYVFESVLNQPDRVPNKISQCTWKKDADRSTTVHSVVDWNAPRPKILPDSLAAVGHTPLIRLNRIPQSLGLECEVVVKCEFLNPGGSVKDRMALRILDDAEKAGVLKPGYTVIEPSSGNTGIGLAMACAIRGYRCIIVIAEKISYEKEYVMRALGTEVVRTPGTANSFSRDGMFGTVHRLKNEIPNSVILDQFSNPSNPLTHYDTTAEEIYHQCDGKVDMIVMGAGTGGSITGLGRKFKEISPQTKIVCSDPYGSVYGYPDSINKTDVTFWEIEGMGYEFLPTCLDREVIDHWEKVLDKDSLPMARRLIKEEGLLIGASCGAILVGALRAAQKMNLGKGHRVVVILPDSIRNYLTKFVCDQWMEQRGLQEAVNTGNHKWWDTNVLKLQLPQLQTASPNTPCEQVLSLMRKSGVVQVPVVDDRGHTTGVVTIQNLTNKLISGEVKPSDGAGNCIDRVYPKAVTSANLGLISRILEKDPYVLVIESNGVGAAKVNKPIGVVTGIDLLSFTQKN
ncbi:unnamed protein product [Phaedon cochleariae]|uniref:Cystathionine beta-synthase n=1 Tax=Phaedon cochleariae TaxID=80249 RepID=A0A9N9X024_PHACE|nr:unnamed protein product [Phaedon cochleariae]